jgi:hypothetical protein
MISRRSAAALLAGLPFAGKAVAREIVNHTSPAGIGAIAEAACPSYYYGSSLKQEACRGPVMQEWEASRLALAHPKMRALMMAAAYAKHRNIVSVDPDIEVYRSFSPMAKITFQRQRNVEREIEQITTEPQWNLLSQARDFVSNLMWGRT